MSTNLFQLGWSLLMQHLQKSLFYFFRHVLIGFSLIHDASDMFFLLNNPNQFISIGVIVGKVRLSLHVTLTIHCILPVMMIEFTRTRLSLETRSPSAIQSVKMTIFFFFFLFIIIFQVFFRPFFIDPARRRTSCVDLLSRIACLISIE